MNITISIEGLDKLSKRLQSIADWVSNGVATDLETAVRQFINGLPPYPSPSGRSMLPFIKSAKQLRWLFWAIRTGQITVPYPRTGALRGGMKSEVRRIGGDIVGLAISTAPSSPYVIDENRQAAYHRGTWWTLQDQFRKFRNTIITILVIGLRKAIRGR